MDVNKITSDVSSFFNRTIQKTEEAFKTAEKTSVDSKIESLTQECTVRNKWAQSLIGLVEAVSEPNPANRMEDKVLSNFDRKKERSSEYEKLGESLVSIAENMGGSTAHGTALTKCGQCENAIGVAGRELHLAIEASYLEWLRTYVNGTCKAALAERKKLEDLRLELDRSKTLLKRAGNDAAKKQPSSATSATITKQQEEVNKAQEAYDSQGEVTRKHLEMCISEFDKHKDQIQKLLDAQRDYYEKCLTAVRTASN